MRTGQVCTIGAVAWLVAAMAAPAQEVFRNSAAALNDSPTVGAPADPAVADAPPANRIVADTAVERAKASDETVRLTELNAANAVAAKREMDAIRAQKEQFARDAAAYRRRLVTDAMAAAEQAEGYEAEMARYRADKARADAAMADYLRRNPKARPK